MPLSNDTVKRYRLRADLTQEALGEIAGVHPRTISKFETGGSVSYDTVAKLAVGLSAALREEVREEDLVRLESNRDHLDREAKTSDFPYREFGQLITQELTQRNTSLQSLAKQMKVSARTVRAWINGASFPEALVPELGKLFAVDDDVLYEMRNMGVRRKSHQISSSDEQSVSLKDVASSIPDQSQLVRFIVSENAMLSLVPTLADENDYDTIVALRAELLAANGPIGRLMERYAQNPNVPQAQLFGSLTLKYHEELSKDPREINYTVLFARGSRFYAARRHASQQIASGEWPELDANENEAIDAICDLHGPLILASAAGRRLVSNAHEFETTPEVYREEQLIIQEFGRTIADEPDIFEPAAAEAITELTSPIIDDPQPARSRGVRLAVTSSALVAIVGGVAFLSAGGAAAVAIPLIAGYGTSKFLWEVAKKTDAFKRTTDNLADRYDQATERASLEAGRQQVALWERAKALVEKKRDLFAKVANMRSEYSWAKRFINKVEQKNYMVPVELNSIVRSAASALSKRALLQNIKITERGLTQSLVVVGDERLLSGLFANLIQNAIQHGGPKDTIEISSVSEDDVAVVSIKDNGSGIPLEARARIFEPFYSADDNPSTALGHGLGLHVSKGIAEQHGGTLEFTSSGGENGVVFRVKIPIARHS